MRLILLIAAGLILGLSQSSRAQTILFQEDFEDGLQGGWKPVKFEGRTAYDVVPEGSNQVMRATAKSSASGLAIEVNAPTKEGLTLAWRWKIDRVPPGATETQKKSFDHTARLFISYKPRIGLPTTLNYVWASSGKLEEVYDHPSSGRSKFIIVQTGNQRAGEWVEEQRDVVADWKKAFGEKPPGTLTAVGFMTDSDGTATDVIGHYDDFILRSGSLNASEPKQRAR